ncbi:low-density lipoprotein receptor-related protein 6 [Nasonia vitripennis]|uniref:Uncharacterized protein n=1 Tax=Nasonia vitripennis TaxID=7425 RepID=A0A7M7G218_NASVI|nr:low-density lipoprotein receptor-related protein 6 [Nasonia vitripennis]
MILFVVSSFLILQAASSAPVNENEAELLVAARNGVYRMNLDGSNAVLVSDAVDARSVDYHHAKHLLFWSDVATHKIYSKDLFDESSEIKTVVAGPNDWEPRAIAVDYVNDKIYVMDHGSRKIDVFELDGSKRISGIQVNLTEPDADEDYTMDIVVDPNEGLVFYGEHNKVMRATMDFTSVKKVGGKSYISGLTIDREAKRFYYADTHRFLWESNYDGEQKDHVNFYDHPSDYVRGTAVSPRSLSKYHGGFFWVDGRADGVHHLQHYSSKPVNTEVKNAFTVRVRHPSLQNASQVKDSAKGCENADCKYMCLVSNPAYSSVTHSCFEDVKQ